MLRDAVAAERDPVVRALEVRLIGLVRDEDEGSAGAILARMDDADAGVRAAAADALGIWREPAFAFDQDGEPSLIDCDPPIATRSISNRDTGPRPSAAVHRERLERMMLGGATAGEREAAARSLVNWPPAGYRLRYAEWGVFTAGDGAGGVEGQLKMALAQLDEVPPFVHRVGNPAAELAERVTPAPPAEAAAFKPVVHLTADRPMAVDLQVCLAGGRPWVAFPRFDDLIMLPRVGTFGGRSSFQAGGILVPPGDVEELEPAGLSPLNDLREGYPWTTPRHRPYPWDESPSSAEPWPKLAAVAGVGVRWQSLIVSPTRLGWMTLADAGADPRFAWWGRLRGVECSWVSSRGESDRLLYYDGPRFRPLVGSARVEGGRVQFDVKRTGDHPACYVRVTKDGVATAWAKGTDESIEVARAAARTADAAVAELRDAAVGRGLTVSEADGLVASWRRAFFETPGERVLTFMSARDYDDACPMVMRPAATERVRVGILWTELP